MKNQYFSRNIKDVGRNSLSLYCWPPNLHKIVKWREVHRAGGLKRQKPFVSFVYVLSVHYTF